jgi:hypothetical protein
LTCNVKFKIRFEYNLNDSEEIFNETGNKVMAEKKSLMEKAMAAAKKVITKPSAKKATPKKAVAKKVITKPSAKKATPKKAVAKKVITKPSAKKATQKKAVAKKAAPIKKVTSSELKQFKSYTPKKNEKYMSKGST